MNLLRAIWRAVLRALNLPRVPVSVVEVNPPPARRPLELVTYSWPVFAKGQRRGRKVRRYLQEKKGDLAP